VHEKEGKKEEKKGKDEKMGGKENGVGSGVIPYFHCMFQKTIRNFIPSFYLVHSVLPEF
jgi:hypothetical protein